MAKVEKQWSWNEDEPDTDYERVGDVDWDDEPYEFEMTRVYKQISTGALFYAEDRGCSCPSPFEDTEDHDLKPIRRMQDWHDHVTARTVYEDPDAEYQYPRPTPARSVDQAHSLTQQINTLLRSDTGTGRVWEYTSTDLY